MTVSMTGKEAATPQFGQTKGSPISFAVKTKLYFSALGYGNGVLLFPPAASGCRAASSDAGL